MAFGGFSGEIGNRPMAEINMIPLIDVMLVLLIIFIVTAPLLTHAIKVDLPTRVERPEHHARRTTSSWGSATDGILERRAGFGCGARAAPARGQAARQPQPELHIRADRMARYEKVAQVMSLAAKAGIARIGFITDPATKE